VQAIQSEAAGGALSTSAGWIQKMTAVMVNVLHEDVWVERLVDSYGICAVAVSLPIL
jgi:hypothetical protein